MNDPTWYVFSLFIFLLVCILIYIYKKLNSSAYKNDNQQNQYTNNREKEDRTFKIFQEFEETIVNLEEYIEKSKADIANDKKNLEEIYNKTLSVLDEISNRQVAIQNEPVINNIKKAAKIPTKSTKIDPVIYNTNSENKNSKVIELYKKDITLDTIAQQLDMSKGEISLIVNLYKKRL